MTQTTPSIGSQKWVLDCGSILFLGLNGISLQDNSEKSAHAIISVLVDRLVFKVTVGETKSILSSSTL